MVAVGLTGDTSINPKVVADYSRKNGYLVNNIGTSWSLMTEGVKHFGLYGTEISLDENGKIIVNDSNSKINSSKKWDIDVFMKETKNLWSFEAI